MNGLQRRDGIALLAGLLGPLAVAVVLLPLRGHIANTDVALLVLAVVGVAANGFRAAGWLAAVSAAVWFDFFWTRPYAHLTITGRADIETFVLLLAVGVAVTEIAVWGRRQHVRASREAGFRAGSWPPPRRSRPATRPAPSSTASPRNWCLCWSWSRPASSTAPASTTRAWSTTAR
jgi:hypothetical protein